jgi:hypothetical protein
MTKRLIAFSFLLAACSSRAEVISWQDMLAMSRACTLRPGDRSPSWMEVVLDSSGGRLFLPATFRRVSGSSGFWRGDDSSEFSYAATEQPSSAGAGSSPLLARIRRPSGHNDGPCRVSIEGRDAILTTFTLVDSAGVDTLYGLGATVALKQHQYAEFGGLTRHAAMRDSLLTGIASFGRD